MASQTFKIGYNGKTRTAVLQQFALLAAQSGHSLRTLCDLFFQRRLRFRKDHRWEQKQHTKKCR